MSDQFDVVEHGPLVQWDTARFHWCYARDEHGEDVPASLSVDIPASDDHPAHKFRINIFTYIDVQRKGYNPGGSAYDDSMYDLLTAAIDELDIRLDEELAINEPRELPNEDGGWGAEFNTAWSMEVIGVRDSALMIAEPNSYVVAKREKTAFAGYSPSYVILDELDAAGAEKFFKDAKFVDIADSIQKKLEAEASRIMRGVAEVTELDPYKWKITDSDGYANVTLVSCDADGPAFQPGDTVKLNEYTVRVESVNVNYNRRPMYSMDGRVHPMTRGHTSTTIKGKIKHVDFSARNLTAFDKCRERFPRSFSFPPVPAWPGKVVWKGECEDPPHEDSHMDMARTYHAIMTASEEIDQKRLEAALRSTGVLPKSEMDKCTAEVHKDEDASWED